MIGGLFGRIKNRIEGYPYHGLRWSPGRLAGKGKLLLTLDKSDHEMYFDLYPIIRKDL